VFKINYNTEIRNKILNTTKDVMESYSYSIKNDREELYEVCKDLFDQILENKFIVHNLKYISINKVMERHSYLTAVLSAVLCIKAGLHFDTTMSTVIGALLHDIGMIQIYENYPILADVSYKYNKKDYEIIQTHPTIGYNMLKHTDHISTLSKKIVLMHHIWSDTESSFNKKFNAYSSYPIMFEGQDLSKTNKDLSIEIVHACSRFANLTDTNKKYRNSVSRSEALSVIMDESYYRFGNAGLLLLNFISPFKINDEILLEDKSKAVVIQQSNIPTRPIVKITTGDMKNRIVDLSNNFFYMIKSLK
jgi:HD-GYP domain-containing protein (c-di-GMP phosphodiesterase class II)